MHLQHGCVSLILVVLLLMGFGVVGILVVIIWLLSRREPDAAIALQDVDPRASAVGQVADCRGAV